MQTGALARASTLMIVLGILSAIYIAIGAPSAPEEIIASKPDGSGVSLLTVISSAIGTAGVVLALVFKLFKKMMEQQGEIFKQQQKINKQQQEFDQKNQEELIKIIKKNNKNNND